MKKRRRTVILSLLFASLLGIGLYKLLPETERRSTGSGNVLDCGTTEAPLYALIVQADVRQVKHFADSLHIGDEPIAYRECVLEYGSYLVVEALTKDQALKLRRVFDANFEGLNLHIHQKVNQPVKWLI